MVFTFQVTETKAEAVRPLEFNWQRILPKEGKSNLNYSLLASNKLDENITRAGINSFVVSAITAYSGHHNLTIRPDDVWIAICTQLANYVNGNSESLRNKFVNFDGKKELVVYAGGTLNTVNYESLCKEMTNVISENIIDTKMKEWLIPNFTTTTATDQTVGAAVMMATMKSYFDYKFSLRCNLPSVTLEGEVEDWQEIRSRANKLLEFDLESGLMTKWTQILFPVLDKLVETAQNKPDIEWWNRIAHEKGGGSGPTYLTGWITTFCVFTDEGKYQGNKRSTTTMRYTIESEWPLIDTQNIPRGYVNVPITVDDNGIIYKTELYAGHMSAIIETETTIKPSVNWALFNVSELN